MKTKGFILLLAAAFLLPVNAEAQLGSKLKKKLEEKVSKALGNEAAEEGQNEEQAAEEREERSFDLSKLGIGKVTASYDENYDFRGMIRMRTEMFDKGKPEGTMDIEMWFNAEMGNLGMESQTLTDEDGQSVKAIAIVDARNRVMITVAEMESGTPGIIMPIPDSLAAGTEEADYDDTGVEIKKSGGSKTICGYRCDEYVATEEDGKMMTRIWVTEDLKMPGDYRLFENQQGMPKGYDKLPVNGAIMASETYEKGTLTTKSEVTKVDLNASHSISLKGVSLMQMEMGKWAQKKR
jgi:hypothetical protein